MATDTNGAVTATEHEMQENMEKVTSKLQRRQDERVAKLEERKLQRETATGKEESANFFRRNFAEERDSVTGRLGGAGQVERAALADFFDALVVSVQRLQKFVTESTLFLTSYEVRRSQTEVDGLLAAIEEKRSAVMPKKKFAFKGRQKQSDKPKAAKAVAVEAKPADETDSPVVTAPMELAQFQCGFSDKSGASLVLGSDEVRAKDVGLANLRSCDVKLSGSANAIHMNNLVGCRVFCGPVPGSVFVDNCRDCTLVVSCQQLRVHHTTDTRFYLHVTSRAIIEDTSGVGFAPYNWTYPGQEADFQQSQLDRGRNNWDDVDDFNWLASDQASPNWTVIPESDRVLSW